jgi:hypothetical protein
LFFGDIPAAQSRKTPTKMDKKIMPWALGFALIVFLSLDFWNWGKAQPFVFGLPYWVVTFIVLNLLLSAYYYLFSRMYWRE